MNELEYEAAYKHHWPHHFTGAQGVILVVDSQSSLESELLMQQWLSTALPNVPLLVCLNKIDLLPAGEASALLAQFHETPYQRAVKTSCVEKSGVSEGLAWLVSKMTPMTQ
jgi:GTPase SAR1 family protein